MGLVELVNDGNYLEYAIRDLAPVAKRFAGFGIPLFRENIGDPIAAGVKVEPWIIDTVTELASDPANWAYPSESAGEPAAREFLVGERNKRGGVKITIDDIIFFSGSGEAIAEVNARLRNDGVLLVPTPGYPTHSSFQADHRGREALFYKLNLSNGWLPDLEQMEEQIRSISHTPNDYIKGVVVINPGNPTGAVFPRQIVRQIVELCDKYGILPIFDECYANLVYNGATFTHLGDVIGDSPGISMRSISKDIPWPGARCGWLEAYNQDKHWALREYFNRLRQSRTLQVGSTTLPQKALPLIYGDPRFAEHLRKWNKQLEEGGNLRTEILKEIDFLSVVPPNGAFYIAAVFEPGVFNPRQELPVMDCPRKEEAKMYLESLLSGRDMPPDKRFILHLMANTGIFAVHLSGFGPDFYGFRVTTLNPNIGQVKEAYRRLGAATVYYLRSGR